MTVVSWVHLSFFFFSASNFDLLLSAMQASVQQQQRISQGAGFKTFGTYSSFHIDLFFLFSNLDLGHGNVSRLTRQRRPAKNSVSSNSSTSSTGSNGSNNERNGSLSDSLKTASKTMFSPTPPSTPSPSHGYVTLTSQDQKEQPPTVLSMLRETSGIHVHLASASSLKTEVVFLCFYSISLLDSHFF